jgi:hypothetical protein
MDACRILELAACPYCQERAPGFSRATWGSCVGLVVEAVMISCPLPIIYWGCCLYQRVAPGGTVHRVFGGLLLGTFFLSVGAALLSDVFALRGSKSRVSFSNVLVPVEQPAGPYRSTEVPGRSIQLPEVNR